MCTRCIAEMDRDTLTRIGDWLLCDDCNEDNDGK